MIQLLPHKDLYAIKVPFGCKNYFIDKGYWHISCFIPIVEEWYTTPTIGEGAWQILGEVTKDSISFDANYYVNKVTIRQIVPTIPSGSGYDTIDIEGYENYMKDNQYRNGFSDSADSIRSLLALNELHLLNPKGTKRPIFAMLSNSKEYIEDCHKITNEWQQYEDNLIEKVIIIQKL